VTDVEPPGIDRARVTEWFADALPAVKPPLRFTLIAGGRSNLTYLVEGVDGRQVVLRRPPLGSVLSTAHDMGREHRVIAALAATDVPVADALGFCADETVNGAPFYVMSYVPGPVLATRDEALEYPEPLRRPVTEDLIAVLARLHRVDPDAVGLTTFGRKEGYIERQLRRWQTQWEKSKETELPVIDEVHTRLAQAIPPQRWTGIVHGDYRIGNMIVGSDARLHAVLDWELATLGDTLADIGWLISSWLEPGEDTASPLMPASSAPGFPTRVELADWYARETGRDLSDLPYYVAFARWRGACIGAGVLARYRADVMGGIEFDVEQQAQSVIAGAERARDALDGNWQ
jgi:aminoglycoside phosphotransferase (APT) family kinase protein